MGDEEATRVCGRCKKEVAEANFALHETHCSRFLVLCPECDENVPRSELEQHKREQHAQVKCPKCRKTMERRLLPEHEEEACPERVQPCVFCELEMPWTQLQEHAVACGSRTELCPDCGRYVKLSDREEHNGTCSDQDLYNEPSAPGGARGPVNTAARKEKVLCKVCKGSFPAEEIKKHEMRCNAAPLWNLEDSDTDEDDYNEASGVDLLSPQFRNLDFPWTFRADQTRGVDLDLDQTRGVDLDLDQTRGADLDRTRRSNLDRTRGADQTRRVDQNRTRGADLNRTRGSGQTRGADLDRTRGAAHSETEDPHELGICPYCQLVLPWVTLCWHVDKCKVHVNLKHRKTAV